MMRVSSGMMINHYMKQINTSYANQAKLMEQSDGSNLHRASDDSVRYSRYLTYQNRDTENLQYQDNVKAGSSWMKTSDAAMVNMTDIYTTLKEKTVDAANDTNNDSDLITAIAKEFKAKLYEMVSLGNNQLGDRYIFAGQSDLTQPFQISTEEKDRGLIKVLDDPQSKFFSNPDDKKNLNADDTGDLKQFLELNDTEGNRYFVNTQNGKIYTEDFIMNGYKDKLKEGIEYVQEGDEYATLPFFDTDALNVAGYFENTGVKRTEGEVTISTSGTAAEPEKYSYGQRLWLTADQTATATVPVYVVDEKGNTRVIAKGNEIKLNDGVGEEAFIGVPLNATKYQTGTVISLGSATSDIEYDSLTFGKGDLYMFDGDVIADADVEYTVPDLQFVKMDPTINSTTYTVKAGETIPSGKTIRFLDNNTHVLLPQLTNAGEGEPQKASYLDSLKSQIADGTISKVVADSDVSFQYATEVGGVIEYTYETVKAGEDLSSGIINANAIAIGDCEDDAAKFQDLLTADNSANVIAYYSNPPYEKLQTGSAILSKKVLETNKQGDYLESLKSEIDTTYSNSAITADQPVTFKTTDSDGNTIVKTVDKGATLNDDIKNAIEIKIGTYASVDDFDNDVEENGNGELTAEISITDNNNSSVLCNIDVMIKNENTGNARIVKAGNPITLEDGEKEAIIMGISRDSHLYSGFTTIKQPIVTYQGDPKYISMVKLNGTVDQMADTVNVTGQDLNGSNIFDDANSGNQTQLMSNGRLCYASSGTAMINDMFTVCAKLEHGDRKWMRTDGITVADKAHEVVTMTQSTMAARQNVYDSVEQMLVKQNETITNDINDVSATDVAELAVKMMQAQTIYNMALSVGSRIIPPTLADYL